MRARPGAHFIAGATGYVGSALVRELRRRGAPVVAHVRPGSSGAERWIERFEAEGALVDRSPWGGDMAAVFSRRGVGTVYALLGTTRARGAAARREGREENYETVDYGLTMELVRAAESRVPDVRVLYLSSMGADRPGRNAYLSARARVEAYLHGSRVPHLVVRPAFITGPNRVESRPLERSASVVVDGVLAVAAAFGASGLRARYGSMTNDELAEALADLGEHGEFDGRVLDPGALRARATLEPRS
ncbi:MAG: NAD(P)H-binding protein [Polyangiales bacterium]|nr:NAD(P)H-binding protein [Myxococcales bacterium]